MTANYPLLDDFKNTGYEKPYFKIMDILALCTKMINDVENIHDFKINQLLDSTINLSLIYLAGLLLCAGAI